MVELKNGDVSILQWRDINELIDYSFIQTLDSGNKNRKAIGNKSPYAGPVDIVKTKDGWIVVQVLGEPLFKRWANLVGAEDFLNDDRSITTAFSLHAVYSLITPCFV